MKRILIRILYEDWFSNELRDGVRYIGIGYLLIPLVLFVVYLLVAGRRNGLSRKELSSELLWLGAIAVAILCLPLVANKLPVQSMPVFGWGFMLVLGFIVATKILERRAQPMGIPKGVIWDFCTYMLVAGIVGARLFYVIQYRERIFDDKTGVEWLKAAVNFSDGGMVFYGGVILGMLVGVRFARKRKLPLLLLADIVIPGAFIGLGFGRIGCLLNGCCYGDFCSLPWAIQFPPGSPPFETLVNRGFLDEMATASLPLHPTQIYSSINAFILAGLTMVWFRYRKHDGEIIILAFLTYPVTRFVLELLRNDEPGQFATNFTISQWVSMGLFVSGWVLLFYFKKYPRPLTPLPLKLEPPETSAKRISAARSA
ncbi:MAG TPA: prolipoprotein diacylglyceryl transferase [Planctomycetaceae bacterium]|nr:prolipoprotein diacylglyceryl transferase [Planctomycetaceae bacterium]